ncbi:hypothetical protein B0H14DRAFT_333874 [Mycena olivaceomarginata]|nr:hypothetical protein B0H14DRAFT_333874 [Mycena olivaceomarginata]
MARLWLFLALARCGFGLAWDLARPKPKPRWNPCQKPWLEPGQAKARPKPTVWPGPGSRFSEAKAEPKSQSQSQKNTKPNTYKICATDPDFFNVMGSPPQRVTFTVDPDVVAACVANGRPVPALPSPSLLAIRAACSRVAHMAGAAEQADQILRDLEDMSVMAENGTTADLFTSRLLQVLPSLRVGA